MALIIDARRCGNTTRIIDELVQKFFTEGECVIYDHYHGDPGHYNLSGTSSAVRNIRKMNMRSIIDRLRREHNLEVGKHIRVDADKFIITRI